MLPNFHYVVFIGFIIWQFAPSSSCINCTERCDSDPWKGGKYGNPGALLRVNDVAIEYAYQLATQEMSTNISRLRAPDVRIFDLSIYGLKVTEYESPQYYRSLGQLNKITWGYKNGKLTLESGFSQIVRKPFVGGRQSMEDQNITGIITMSTDSSSMESILYMNRDIDGRPTIYTPAQCTAKIGWINVTLSGTASASLSGYTIDLIKRTMQNVFEAFVCTTARIIVSAVNAQLKTFQSKVKLDNQGMVLDYGLLDNPRVTVKNDAIDGNLKGSVYFKNAPVFPFYPPTILSNVSDNSSMVEFHLTSYALNTLFYTAHQQNMLKLSATAQFLSSNISQMLRLSCPANNICVGNIFKELNSFGPNAYINVSIQTTQPPKAQFNFDEAYWLGKGRAQMDIVDESKKSTKMFSANASCVYGVLSPRVYHNTLFASTNVTYMNFQIDDSPMKKLSDDEVAILKRIVTVILEELLNGFLSVGFPIPLLDGVTLDNPQLQVLPGSIYVVSNLTYTSSSEVTDKPTTISVNRALRTVKPRTVKPRTDKPRPK